VRVFALIEDPFIAKTVHPIDGQSKRFEWPLSFYLAAKENVA
jgi:hypothetical protein